MGKISQGLSLLKILEQVPILKKIIEIFSKRKPHLEGPCTRHLLHGLGVIERGRRKNNKDVIREGVEILENVRNSYPGGVDNACFSYGTATGYLLLGDHIAAYKAVEGINGKLKPYKEIQDLQKYLRELSLHRPKK